MTDFAKTMVIDFWATVAEMSPYLLFGFLVAGILSVLISQRVVEKHLGGKGIWPLVKASLFGVPLPLCSCGVIPVSMSLHKHGASKGSAVSFLLSTPQTGADSIFVTLSLLGPLFAIFRPLAAFITGIIGGTLVNMFDKEPDDKEQKSQEYTEQHYRGKQDKKIFRGLRYGFVTLPRDIGRAMLVGLIIAAVISALVPDGYFAEHLGTGIFAMVVMIFLGIPVYVCATASVPIAAAMIVKGLAPGAALVFLMTGPATNAASFVTIWKTLGAKTALAYIISIIGCALTAGLLLNQLAEGLDLNVTAKASWMLPNFVKNASAVALIAILIIPIIKKNKDSNN